MADSDLLMTPAVWYWSADLLETLPLAGSVGAGLIFLATLYLRWDSNIAAERARSDRELKAERSRSEAALNAVKKQHQDEMSVVAGKADRLERALAALWQASEDPDIRRAVTIALWPEGKPEARGRRSRHDGP